MSQRFEEWSWSFNSNGINNLSDIYFSVSLWERSSIVSINSRSSSISLKGKIDVRQKWHSQCCASASISSVKSIDNVIHLMWWQHRQYLHSILMECAKKKNITNFTLIQRHGGVLSHRNLDQALQLTYSWIWVFTCNTNHNVAENK